MRGATAGPSASRWLSDGALLLTTFVWGSSFVVVRDALVEASPLAFVAVRFSLAAVVLAAVLLLRGARWTRAEIVGGAWIGSWLFLGFALQCQGLATTQPARAAFLTGLCVVLVPILVVLVDRRLPALPSLGGVALAIVGLALLTGTGGGGIARGDLLILGCAAAFAAQILVVERFASIADPLRLLAVEVAVVAVLAWPLAALLEPIRLPRSVSGWSQTSYIAFLATLAAFLAQNWAQRRTPPTRTAVILTMEPVFAALWSYLTTGERLGREGLAGSALILAGMLVAELPARPGRRREGTTSEDAGAGSTG